MLAELEQLEKKYDSNVPAPESNSPSDDSLSEVKAFKDKKKRTASRVPVEEVVPSFLTQSDSTSSSPAAILGWLAGTIVLLIVLAAQYLHVNSIQLAQNPTFRPILESLCSMTSCALPLIKAPGQIITVNHDVRSHPKRSNALEVHLTFKNKAAFTQDYPILEIIFSNPRGEVIARRKFTPVEYLTGNIQNTRSLKNNQSQEITLNIVDPDPGSLLSFQFNYL